MPRNPIYIHKFVPTFDRLDGVSRRPPSTGVLDDPIDNEPLRLVGSDIPRETPRL
jgi:hypothetical protein